jgi:hypothetical protein
MIFIHLKQVLMIFIGALLSPVSVDFGQLWGQFSSSLAIDGRILLAIGLSASA